VSKTSETSSTFSRVNVQSQRLLEDTVRVSPLRLLKRPRQLHFTNLWIRITLPVVFSIMHSTKPNSGHHAGWSKLQCRHQPPGRNGKIRFLAEHCHLSHVAIRLIYIAP